MDYVVFGQVITDDIYFPGKEPMKNFLGGAVYTASGIRIWSESVGICSGVGRDFEGLYSSWFDENGIDRRGCIVKAKRSCHSVIHYFEDGEREELPVKGCATIDDMYPAVADLPEDYKNCRGFYFFKDCDSRFWEEVGAYMSAAHPVAVWEIHASAAWPEYIDKVCALLPEVDIFSINQTEGRRLLGLTDPIAIVKRLVELGARNVLYRMGSQGALAGNTSHIWHIPAVRTLVKDVTGGGNSSTGGFLAGFCENNGDIELAGRWASASASFIIEQFGQPKHIDDKVMQEAHIRAKALKTECVWKGGSIWLKTC